MKETLRFDEAQTQQKKHLQIQPPERPSPRGETPSRGRLSDRCMRDPHDERNKIKILLRSEQRCAILKAAEPLEGGERSFWDAELC